MNTFKNQIFILSLLVFSIASIPTSAQIVNQTADDSFVIKRLNSLNISALDNVQSVSTMNISKISNDEIAELYKNEKEIGFRFGHEFDVNLDFFKKASQFIVSDSVIVWLLKIESKNAYSLNLDLVISEFKS
ncbi:MAG: hypothetical protein ACOCWM_00930 [Cyclobacteriaceae bacterium]